MTQQEARVRELEAALEEEKHDRDASDEALVAQYEISTALEARAEAAEAERAEDARALLRLIDLVTAAETEVERLREAQHQAVIGWDAEREKSERLRAALLDAQHQEAQDIEALGKLEAERDEARADWVALVDENASTEAERDEARAEVDSLRERLSAMTEDYIRHRNALERAEAALREWREAESLPDCAACSVLDAALAGAEPEATDGHWPDVNVGNPAPEVKP